MVLSAYALTPLILKQSNEVSIITPPVFRISNLKPRYTKNLPTVMTAAKVRKTKLNDMVLLTSTLVSQILNL